MAETMEVKHDCCNSISSWPTMYPLISTPCSLQYVSSLRPYDWGTPQTNDQSIYIQSTLISLVFDAMMRSSSVFCTLYGVDKTAVGSSSVLCTIQARWLLTSLSTYSVQVKLWQGMFCSRGFRRNLKPWACQSNFWLPTSRASLRYLEQGMLDRIQANLFSLFSSPSFRLHLPLLATPGRCW